MRDVTTLIVQPATRLFKALGDETRLRIVALLSHGELCVCHVESALGLSQPNASRHLTVLKNAGVVDHRRQGNWVYYRLVQQQDPHCARQLKVLVAGFASQKELAEDLRRVMKARGPNACR